jgi:signal transduction histidine kinase
MDHAHHATEGATAGASWFQEFLNTLLGTSWYMPHGHCYLWQPALLWLHAVSDFLIGAAYFFISLMLYLLVRRIRLPFSGMIVAFGVFIGACGLTHFMEVWNVWNSAYWLAGGVKAVTAFASVLTGVYLVPLRGQVAELASAARLAEERRTQLESKNQELEALYAKLKESEELRSQFFTNVSHELRTPLALILGPLEKLLDEGPLTEAQRRELELVERNANLLLKQVNDLLDTSKLEAGQLSAQRAPGDLARLVRTTTAYFTSIADERRVEHAVEAPESLPSMFDAEKLQRVLLNLLANAFKFVPDGGRIRTTLRQDGERAVLTVEDNGPGVKPELREVIFERFRQGEGGLTRRFGGTGLGLTIARSFVELHGGTILVDASPLGGARFTVVLPLVSPSGIPADAPPPTVPAQLEAAARRDVEALRTAVPAAPAPSALPAPSADPHRHVGLVVEDNPDMRQFIAGTLGTEMQVLTAENGREGLEKARALRPDVVVSDLMMPTMTGAELVRALRADRDLEGVPVLLLTAKADEALKVQLLRAGAQDYLTKPFHAEELRARVRNLVSTKRARETLQRELAAREDNLEELAEELAVRKRQLEAALDVATLARQEAERASMAKSTFLQLVSHELRTPLAAIQLNVQRLSLKEMPGGVAERLGRSFKRLSDLIESILEYTRIESGKLIVRVERFDVVELAGEVVEELLPQAQQKLLRLELLPAPALPLMESDPRLVRLVLINLVMNAVKYTTQGSIEVVLTHGPEGHTLAVRDTGPGIAPEVHARIFEPFEQLEPIRHKHTPGVGLGLALVREMVSALGGRIHVDSQVGQGSTFTVVLPARPPGAR